MVPQVLAVREQVALDLILCLELLLLMVVEEAAISILLPASWADLVAADLAGEDFQPLEEQAAAAMQDKDM